AAGLRNCKTVRITGSLLISVVLILDLHQIRTSLTELCGGVGWAALPDKVTDRAKGAAHAVMVIGSVIAPDDLAANDLRVGGAHGAASHLFTSSRPPYATWSAGLSAAPLRLRRA